MAEEGTDKDVQDVVSTLQSFHIGEGQSNPSNNQQQGNVFQRSHRRLQTGETAGVVSSEYSSDDSQSSNEKKSFKQRIQRKLNQKSPKPAAGNQVPDLIPKSDPLNNGSNEQQNKENFPSYSTPNQNDTKVTPEIESNPSVDSTTQSTEEPKPPERRRRRFITRDKEADTAEPTDVICNTDTSKAQSRRSLLNQGDTDTATLGQTRTRTRSRQRSQNNTVEGPSSGSQSVNDTALTSSNLQRTRSRSRGTLNTPSTDITTETSRVRTRSRSRGERLIVSVKDQNTTDSSQQITHQSHGDSTGKGPGEESQESQPSRRSDYAGQREESQESQPSRRSDYAGQRAKSVERTVRVRSRGLLNSGTDLSKSLNVSSPGSPTPVGNVENEQKKSINKSAVESIRLRRAQSFERGQRPKITSRLSPANKSCDDKQLSVPASESTQTPVIGSPLIAKLESTYKLLRSRSTRLSSDTSSKSEESVRNTSNTDHKALSGETNSEESRGIVQDSNVPNDKQSENNTAENQGKELHDKDITLIFKSNETMNRPVDPAIHQPEIRTSKLDPSIYPEQNISNSSKHSTETLGERNLNQQTISSQEQTPHPSDQCLDKQDQSSEPTVLHRSPAPRSMSETSDDNHNVTPKCSSKSLDIPDSNQRRTPLVTDLDQAMKQRDEEKLRKLFKNTESGIQSAPEENNTRHRHTSGVDMETDLDNITTPTTKTTNAGIQSKTLSSPSSPKVFLENDQPQNGHKPCTNLFKNLTNPKPFQPGAEHRSVSSAVAQLKPEEPREDNSDDPSSKEYSPYVNLEDSVKWPPAVPGKLDFSHMEVFEGRMLLQWLTSSIDDNHYLRMMLTRHDLNVIGSQYCTCLIAAGVIKEVNRKDSQWLFKTDCMYYWAHTDVPKSRPNDIGKLTPAWPPPLQISEEELQAGRKFTEADQQAMLVTVRNEYKTELEKVETDHQNVLKHCREEYQSRLQNCVEKIAFLEREVERYKELAGIEKHSQTALSAAQAAENEAVTNGYYDNQGQLCVAVTGTPHQQHTLPAVTPECVQGSIPGVQSDEDIDLPVEKLKFSPENIGGKSTIPPPPPPPPPDIPPPPPPPIPGAPPPPPGPPGAPPPPGLHHLTRRDEEVDSDMLDILRRPLYLPGSANVKWTFPAVCSSLKPVISTKSPMKPLFWNRIVVNDIKSPKHKEYVNARLVWEEIDEARINMDEVDELFSKVPVETTRKSRLTKSKSPPKQFAKVIEPKRSQAIGILLSSLRLDFFVIENAIMNLDTSQVELEKLKAIYDNRADEEEMKKIKKHLDQNPGIPLDKPDQFLYDLTVIPDFAERMFCFLFQESFQESIAVIENKLNNLKMTTDLLMNGKGVKDVLGLVLAVGNYMNGGNRSRGQADGFDISILPRLKDVKTKDNRSSLLQFVVSSYIKRFDYDNAGTEKAMLPLPDPSDISQAMLVNFDEINKELKRIRKEFEATQKRSQKVIKHSHQDDLQPFKAVMEDFCDKGKHDIQEQEDSIKEAKQMFDEIAIYFCVRPKQGDKVVTPEYFFFLWSSFTEDFKQMWKKEQQKVLKIKLQEAEKRLKQLQESKKAALLNTRTRKAGGLKDKLANKGML